MIFLAWIRSETDQVLTFDYEKTRIIPPFPTLRSLRFYATNANEKSRGRFAMTYIAYANGTLTFQAFFLKHLPFL